MSKNKDFREVISGEHPVQIFKRNELIVKHEQTRQILLFASKIAKLVVEETENI